MRLKRKGYLTVCNVFQFTHPGRGATLWRSRAVDALYRFQFTHPGRGATVVRPTTLISLRFQFTHPGRGATQAICSEFMRWNVSIHAPREGCDLRKHGLPCSGYCFNSRTPGGVRPEVSNADKERILFQFTHPGRGATPFSVSAVVTTSVSIHAPREGCD